MRKPFTCPHPDEQSTLRRRLTASNTVMVGHQCGECGGLVGQWVKLERVPQWRSLPEWDHEIQPRWELAERARLEPYREWKLKQTPGVDAFAAAPQRKTDLFWARYSEYLQSPAWRDRRELVLRRAHGVCEGCGLAEATQVHHLNYSRVGREMLFDLVAVCDECHDQIHGKDE